VEFLGFIKLSDCQASLRKSKAPLLKTFWRWFTL